MIKTFFILIFGAFVYSCSDDSALDKDVLFKNNIKVLFVGNSLTYTNDLPNLFKDEAVKREVNVEVTTIAKPNYAISDHWDELNVQNEINNNAFDFVIVQQGPSSQSEGREILIEYGKKYKDLCDSNGTTLCFYMVWPSLTFYHTFDGVINNYRDAATINNAVLCPVGEVWKTHFDNTDCFDYYGPDGFHPSLLGSQVAASVIADSILE